MRQMGIGAASEASAGGDSRRYKAGFEAVQVGFFCRLHISDFGEF